MHYIGIDPGLKGAISILNEQLAIVAIHDMPTRKAGKSAVVCALKLGEIFKPYSNDGSIAVIETAIVMPPMTRGACRTVGVNYGTVLATLLHHGIGYREYSPNDWKKRLNLNAEKSASIALCTSLYPRDIHRFTRHDQAESILIPRAALRNGVII